MGGVRRLLKTGQYYDLKPWVTGGPYAVKSLRGHIAKDFIEAGEALGRDVAKCCWRVAAEVDREKARVNLFNYVQ